MHFLKKTDEKLDSTSKKIKVKREKNIANTPKVIVKKRKKISFGRKKNEKIQKGLAPETNKSKDEIIENEIIPEENITTFKTENKDKLKPEKEDDFSEDFLNVDEEVTSNTKKEKDKQWSPSKKKKKLIQPDMKGKPVFLEDTGEKLGIVFDMMYDVEKRHIGYKIKDKKSDSVLCFPVDQFDVTKDGLIFVQGWYTKAVKTIEQLEFKERVSPELTTLISDDTISNEELYNIFVKHDDQMAHYIEESVSLKDLLIQRLKALNKQRLALKDDLMDLTEKRLIKDIDRTEFSEDVVRHRYKVNVLDVNISKCKDLLNRLDNTSFGKLSKQIVSNIDEIDRSQFTETIIDDKKSQSSLVYAEEIENPYKQKYDDMKERFEQLQDEYDELKSAVEKLVDKGEL